MATDDPDPEALEFPETWAVTDRVVNQLPMIVRVRQRLEHLAGHPQFATRLRVLWSYSPDGDFGLPPIAEMQRMDVCENTLLPMIERDRVGILTHILTGDSLRQWIFYVRDIETVVSRIQTVMAQDETWSLEATAADDPTWEEYLTTLKSITPDS